MLTSVSRVRPNDIFSVGRPDASAPRGRRDALDGHLRAVRDLQRHVDLGAGAPDGAVELENTLHALPELGPGEDLPGHQPDLAADLFQGEHARPGRHHTTHGELGALHHPDCDRDPPPGAVQADLVARHPGADVTVVLVEGGDPLEILLQALALEDPAEDEKTAAPGSASRP